MLGNSWQGEETIPERNSAMEELLLREEEVRQALKISRTSLWRLVRSGQLPVVRIGRSLRFSNDVVRAWVADQVELNNETNRTPTPRQ
jgi:excisionase family DNA binding protein